MDNEVLNLILNRLDNIDSSLKELHIDQTHIKEEQQEIKAEQQAMKEEQHFIRNEQTTMKEDIQAIKEDIKEIHRTDKWLRDDIETIYILQQEDHKLLNKCIEQLNILIALANDNQYEHANFEKRIARLEALN